MRPPYRVPTMDEIRALPWNGYAVASLFAGGGGSSTGYRMAGYRVAYANDVVAEARETYLANCAEYTVVDGDDIRAVPGSRILDAAEALTGLRYLDVLDGSPPCQAFSDVGPKDRGWGKVMDHADGTTQRSDDLFFEYARVLSETRPSVFVAENVHGLVRGTARGYFKRILAALRETGYLVEARLINSEYLGVCQDRRRMIFIGVRGDLVSEHSVAPVFPAPLPYTYPRSCLIPGAVRVEMGAYGKMRILDVRTKCSFTITASGYGPTSTDRTTLVLKDGTRRRFTIKEIQAIGSFPPDYVLTGSYRQQWTRIGNSVPPLMMKAVAETIRERILDRIGARRGEG